jgi:hypothetical protein
LRHARRKERKQRKNERVSVWFRGLSVRNIALGTNRSSSGQVNAILLGACDNLKACAQSTAARPVAALMYGVCRPLSVFHPVVLVHSVQMHAGRTIPLPARRFVSSPQLAPGCAYWASFPSVPGVSSTAHPGSLDHGTSKAPRKGNNSVQHTLVLGCHHCGLDFLRNIDYSAALYAALHALPLPSFHRWIVEFVYQRLPKPKDNGPDY